MDRNDKYDYSESFYIDAKTKIKIICKEHGVFEQTPGNHLFGQGCLKCAIKNNTNKQRYGNDIKYFIRFNYKEKITRELVLNKINEVFCQKTP